MTESVVVVQRFDDNRTRSEALAGRLRAATESRPLPGHKFVLSFDQGRLALSWVEKKNLKPIWVELSPNDNKRAILKGLLAKAIGIKSKEKPWVIDACAGLGTDGLTMASLGCPVTMIERSPVVFELLRDGIERIPLATFNSLPKLVCADAHDYLDRLSHRPDVIYLDPMYPKPRKKSLAKKEMRMLQELVGNDPDSPALLQRALGSAKKRVVVKRRRLDQFLGGIKPSLSFIGKAVRFDVYLIAGL